MVTPAPHNSGSGAAAAVARTRRHRRWPVILALGVLSGGACFVVLSRAGKLGAPPVRQAEAPRNVSRVAAVGGPGRVEPENGVVIVAAAPQLGRAPVVAKLLVEVGQMVAAGQAIATLESLPDLQAAVRQSESRLAVAKSRLAQLEAGARPADVLALKSEVARIELDSQAARQEFERKEALAQKDFVPRMEVDAARLKVEETGRLLDAARHRLESLTAVPQSDLDLARAEVSAAQVDLDRAQIQESTGTVRAPERGRVIRVSARAGEAVGPDGLVALADTNRMEVIAEIYETDVARVRVGQKAQVTADWLSSPLNGVVRWISPEIASHTLPVEPSAAADERVYQARIRMEHPEMLAHRINSKVNVRIGP